MLGIIWYTYECFVVGYSLQKLVKDLTTTFVCSPHIFSLQTFRG